MKYRLTVEINDNPYGIRCITCPLCNREWDSYFCPATGYEFEPYGMSEKVLMDSYGAMVDKCPLEVCDEADEEPDNEVGNCQTCEYCKVSHDAHKSYLYCEQHCGEIDKNTWLSQTCGKYERWR